jgi:hypothetical protein
VTDFFSILDIDVARANSHPADHEIVMTPPAIPSQPPQQEVSTMSPPTHVIIPPTPVAPTTNNEQDRPSSEPENFLSATTPLSSPPSSTSSNELNDPLSEQWRQPPRLFSPLFRRLSGHRRTRSLPGDLQGTVSNLAPDRRHENDDDIMSIPGQLLRGMEMLRVTRKKITKRICWIDPISACVAWDLKNSSKCMCSTKI